MVVSIYVGFYYCLFYQSQHIQFGCSEQPIYELPQSNDLLVSDFCVRVIFDIGLWHQESAYPLHGN